VADTCVVGKRAKRERKGRKGKGKKGIRNTTRLSRHLFIPTCSAIKPKEKMNKRPTRGAFRKAKAHRKKKKKKKGKRETHRLSSPRVGITPLPKGKDEILNMRTRHAVRGCRFEER
jgi:hypothetical protein